MPDLLRPRLARYGLACFLSLGLLAAACGDDRTPPGDGGDDGDDGDDDGNTLPVGITIEGMDGPVDVTFDESGIMHAGCSSDADCFAVEGYFHAAHRFGQMDIRRRVGRGRLAALAGAITLETSDKPQRAMMTSRDGTPLEDQLLASADDRTKAALEAYSRGVNAWLADLAAGENGAELPDEYAFPIINQDAVQDDWEPVDSVACILPLVDELTDFASIDIALGDVYAALDPDVAADLFSLRPPSTSTVLPPSDGLAPVAGAARAARARTSADVETRRRIHERMVAARPLLAKALATRGEVKIDHSSKGSNNWIVGPSQAAGSTLLANDPHLGMAHPAIWYLVNLDAVTGGGGDIHVAGASFAGLPGIVLGQNENIAWGATTTYFDSTDVYIETLNEARDAVLFNGEEVPLENIDYTFEVAGAAPVTSTFQYVPHHGPIISVDEDAGTALSVRWTGHEADTDINFFLGLATAASVDDARVALEQVTTAGQNFVVIDRWGSIGWFPYNRLPTRPWLATNPEFPPFLPLPGDGSAEWGDPIPYADLPQAVDPPAGFLATANNDMTGALQDGDETNGDLPYIQGVVDEGYRHQRIVQRLSERSDHDRASMESIQSDVHSLLGELLVPEILALTDRDALSPDGQAVYDAMADWQGDFECLTGIAGSDPAGPADPDTAVSARGCLAFHATWGRLRNLVFGDELAAAGVTEPALPSALIFLLTEDTFNQDYWDDVSTNGPAETPDQIVAAAIDDTGAYLREQLGDPDAWLWGRVHTLTLAADLFSAAGVTQFDSDTYTNDGGLFTVDVANPRNELADQYNQTAGPSMRLACQANDAGVGCSIELPGGQRHLRDSPFYTSGTNSMMPGWLANQSVPLLFSIDEATAAAAETVHVEPR